MWKVVVFNLALGLAATVGWPTSSPETKELAKQYAMMHPNTEYLDGNILVQKSGEKPDDKLQRNPLNAVTKRKNDWFNGIIYYTIRPDGYTKEEIALIENGINDLVDMTRVNGKDCIQILPRGNESDYVQVENNRGFASYNGPALGKHRINLASKYVRSPGAIMHLMLHGFGFHHEVQRADRDDWVTIVWDNIQPGMAYNFEKLAESKYDLLGTPYDYGSIMHYGPYRLAIDPTRPTIIPHDATAEIGQLITLSPIDIERIQILYGCIAKTRS